MQTRTQYGKRVQRLCNRCLRKRTRLQQRKRPLRYFGLRRNNLLRMVQIAFLFNPQGYLPCNNYKPALHNCQSIYL